MKLRLFPSPVPAVAPANAGLELLAAAVLMLRADGRVTYVNPAAENLFELSRPKFLGHTPRELFGECAALEAAVAKAVVSGASYTEQELELGVAGRARLHLTCTVSPIDTTDAALLVEFRHIDQQLKGSDRRSEARCARSARWARCAAGCRRAQAACRSGCARWRQSDANMPIECSRQRTIAARAPANQWFPARFRWEIRT